MVSLASLLCVAAPAAATTTRYVRTSLEQDGVSHAQPNAARLIRNSLDDASHADFPADDTDNGRRIRISLEDGSAPYGQLSPAAPKARRFRMTLD